MDADSPRVSRRGGLRMLVIMLAVGGWSGCRPQTLDPVDAAAVATIERLAGTWEFDTQEPQPSIVKVDLHDTRVVDADLEAIGKLPQLKSLYLGRTGITDAGLAHLRSQTSLQTLGLHGTQVTDAGLTQLTGLSQLKTLNLQETAVTAQGAATLQHLIPGLTVAR